MNSVLLLRLQFSLCTEENSVGFFFFLERAPPPPVPVNIKLLFSGHDFTVISDNKRVQIHLGDEPPPVFNTGSPRARGLLLRSQFLPRWREGSGGREKDPLEIGFRSNPASVFVPLSLVYSDFGGLTP